MYVQTTACVQTACEQRVCVQRTVLRAECVSKWWAELQVHVPEGVGEQSLGPLSVEPLCSQTKKVWGYLSYNKICVNPGCSFIKFLLSTYYVPTLQVVPQGVQRRRHGLHPPGPYKPRGRIRWMCDPAARDTCTGQVPDSVEASGWGHVVSGAGCWQAVGLATRGPWTPAGTGLGLGVRGQALTSS